MNFKIQKALENSPENFKIQKLGENFEFQKLRENFKIQKALEISPENFEFQKALENFEIQKALENSPENFKIQKALENSPVLLKSLLKVANCPKLTASGEISFSKTKLKNSQAEQRKMHF